jgi:hypothetical protein
MVHPDAPFCRVIPENKKILNKPDQRHICWSCYTDWKHNRKFQMIQSVRDGWQSFKI